MNTANIKPFLIGAGILAIGVIGLVVLVALTSTVSKYFRS